MPLCVRACAPCSQPTYALPRSCAQPPGESSCRRRQLLLEQWDTDSNAQEGHTPESTSFRCYHKRRWTCSGCPECGQQHRWAARVLDRHRLGKETLSVTPSQHLFVRQVMQQHMSSCGP